ncbi:MAG TPA: exodeoxyribonuclease VII large subunit, partial [Stenotrophomonas sp.]|nr:exodeoxyribonuclease VII large subunit [Stenotrophomonas sp.]
AVRDVLSVLARRFPMLEVELLPSLVQGDSAAAQITALLRRADASARYDVILLTRGGGSLEDLWAFNDEQLARAIAASATPVVSAVGHETDFSLADFAADLRAPTPSVAAELLVPDQRELAARVQRAQAQLAGAQRHWLRQWMQRADRAGLRLDAQSPRARLQLLHRRQEDAARHLSAQLRGQLERLQARLRHAQAQLRLHDPARQLDTLRRRLAALRLQPPLAARLRHDTLRLHALARSLEAVSPLATVARGYAIVSREDGSVVRSAAQVGVGERLRARVGDGVIAVRVEGTDDQT